MSLSRVIPDSSDGRAPARNAGGPGFESRLGHIFFTSLWEIEFISCIHVVTEIVTLQPLCWTDWRKMNLNSIGFIMFIRLQLVQLYVNLVKPLTEVKPLSVSTVVKVNEKPLSVVFTVNCITSSPVGLITEVDLN